MKAAVFFERDGVLNLCETVNGHQKVPLRLEQFRINPEAVSALRELKLAGYVLIATSNQPAVSLGDLTRNELDLMHAVLRRKLPLDDVLCCPYDDVTHPCYKPHPGMFLEAAFKWSLDLDRSFVISNKWSDAKAAQIAGCTSVMIQSPWIGDDHHDFVVADLAAAVGKIAQLNASLSASHLAYA
jgi:D-glycero-D-manno-heptose 1,7-bisphosphate phosphatase